MGDNDAWIAALAYAKDAIVVGNDDDAFKDRPSLDYTNFTE
jgi:predicted nucleic acid-binding protein